VGNLVQLGLGQRPSGQDANEIILPDAAHFDVGIPTQRIHAAHFGT
jgi:hypothetical protein